MRPSSQVLVVSRNYPQRDLLCRWLVSAGYNVDLAADFDGARSRLETASPDLLVADVKLGAYNGLHLAIWSRGRRLTTKTLLIGEADRVLQKEAERERAVYLTPPLAEKPFIAVVASLLGSYSPARRSPRKRVTIGATVDGVSGSLVDLSHDGLCIALPNADGITLPSFFTLLVPEYDLACRLRRVWTGRPANAQGTLLCGAALPEAGGAATAWRSFVDALPGGTPAATESTG